jgi:predicted  nucleic acid-binding Zn-ribbon protein
MPVETAPAIEVSQLVELQAVDTQLQDLNELLGDLPKKVDKLRQEEESLINAVDKGKNRLKEIKLALNKAEHRMAEIKQKIDKLKDQLSLVTSNKQYDALTQEIEYLKQEMDEVELEDLELEEEKETLQNDLQEKEENLESLSENLSTRRDRLEDLIAESADKKSELEKVREEKSIHIDPSLLGRYMRIRDARDGLAVVTLDGNSCSGCGFVVPTQSVSFIRKKTLLYNCDICSRFLYFDK